MEDKNTMVITPDNAPADRPIKRPRKMPKSKPIHKGPKIYPNDPCHCGSGKKYKKCHGKN